MVNATFRLYGAPSYYSAILNALERWIALRDLPDHTVLDRKNVISLLYCTQRWTSYPTHTAIGNANTFFWRKKNCGKNSNHWLLPTIQIIDDNENTLIFVSDVVCVCVVHVKMQEPKLIFLYHQFVEHVSGFGELNKWRWCFEEWMANNSDILRFCALERQVKITSILNSR